MGKRKRRKGQKGLKKKKYKGKNERERERRKETNIKKENRKKTRQKILCPDTKVVKPYIISLLQCLKMAMAMRNVG